MRASRASRTLVVTTALMLAVGVAACADDDASGPAQLPGVEAAAPAAEVAEETGEALTEAVEEAPIGEASPPAEPAKESPDGSGPSAAEPEEAAGETSPSAREPETEASEAEEE